MANTDTRYEYGHDNRIDLIKRALEQHLNDQSNPHKVSLASLGEKEFIGSGLEIEIEGNPEDFENRKVILILKNREGGEVSRVTLPMNGNATTWSEIIGDDPLVNDALNTLISNIENTNIAGIPLKDSENTLKNYHYSEYSGFANVFNDLIDCSSFGVDTVYNDSDITIIKTEVNSSTGTIQISVNKDNNKYIYISGVDSEEDQVPAPNTWYRVIDDGESIEYISEKPAQFIAKTEYILNQELFDAICTLSQVQVPITLKEKIEDIETNIGTINNNVDNLQSAVTNLDSSKQDKITSNNKLSYELVNGLATVAHTGNYADLTGTPTNTMTVDTEQTITGKKTFNTPAYFNAANGTLKIEGTHIIPESNSNLASGILGDTNNKFKEGYIENIYSKESSAELLKTDKIKKGASTFGIVVPETTNYNSDKVLAVTEDIKNSTITVQVTGNTPFNSTATFTLNQNQDKTITITLPNKVSDFANDAEYITKEVNNLTNYTKSSELADVATSGSYNNLLDTPTIGNGNLDIIVNGSTTTFNANATTNTTVNVDIPIIEIQKNGQKIEPSNRVVNITVPTIPVNVSAFNNDANYVYSSAGATVTLENYANITNNIITIGGQSITYGANGANKLVQTDSDGKIDGSLIPSSLTGQMIYAGTFDASTKVATLTDAAKSKFSETSTDWPSDPNLWPDTITFTDGSDPNDPDYTTPALNQGMYYIAKVATPEGTTFFNNLVFAVGDWLVSTGGPNGSVWDLIENLDAVKLVNGQTGNVEVPEPNKSLEIQFNGATIATYTPTNMSLTDAYTPSVQTITISQEQADWGQTVTTAVDYIKNKPTLLTKVNVNNTTYTMNNGEITLPNYPEVPITGISINGTAQSPSLGIVNITVPTDTGDLTNNAGFITGINSSDVTTAIGYTPLQTAPVTSVNGMTGTVTITIPETVSANTGETPSATLADIQVGATVYAIPSGGGTEVEANPTVTSSTDPVLSCIKIAGTTYRFAGFAVEEIN